MLSATKQPLVVLDPRTGVPIIQVPTPLTRLHYYDGKFLRASHLDVEQAYVRQLAALANQAGGSGLVNGFDVSLAGDALRLGAGLAIDPSGRVLLLPESVDVPLARLLEAARQASASAAAAAAKKRLGTFDDCEAVTDAPDPTVPRAGDFYLVTIAHAEALCGEEEVFGQACEQACVTSTERPYAVEGIVVRLRPLSLSVPLIISATAALSEKHLRSRLASAYFADEARRVAALISKEGLRGGVWCRGAEAPGGPDDVPVGILARAGGRTVFLDEWAARRERIEPPARRYWAWRMAMRPWDVFLAQILQFQCQLRDSFQADPDPGGEDPCAHSGALLGEASEALDAVLTHYASVAAVLARPELSAIPNLKLTPLAGGLTSLSALRRRLLDANKGAYTGGLDRLLIRGGIVEVPSAGYLPIDVGTDVTVNGQVRRLMGEGVDLRFCVVRPDYVPHALEEAQHAERISLVAGLDDPSAKPEVDVLVPNGEIVNEPRPAAGLAFAVDAKIWPAVEADPKKSSPPLSLQGAGRADRTVLGGGEFYHAGAGEAFNRQALTLMTAAMRQLSVVKDPAALRTAIEAMRRATPPGPARPPVRLSRLNAVTAAALKFNAEMLKADPNANRPPFDPEPQGQAEEPPLTTNWLAASCDRDPFALASGETTSLSLRVALLHPEMPRLDFVLYGRLIVASVTPPPVRTLTGRLEYLASVVELKAPPLNPDSLNSAFEVRAVLDTTPGRDPSLRVDLLDRQGEEVRKLVIEATWSGSPLKAKLSLEQVSEEQSFRVAEVALTADPAVSDPANARHETALHALAIIQAVFNQFGLEPNFAEVAAKQLFPPLAPPDPELKVRATADWVLFHRRRTKACHLEAPPPPAVPARTFQLWLVRSSNRQDADRAAKLLQSDRPLDKEFALELVGSVGFAPGIANLTTPEGQVRSDWVAHRPGNTISFAAIAAQGGDAGEGRALAMERLGRVVPVLARESPLDAQFFSAVLPQVPAQMLTQGSDGVVVAVTFDRPRLDAENTLRQVALAMFAFANQNERLPSNSYRDKQPLLSWRVHLLPWLEEEALFRKFRLDEPWDSPNNRPLANETVKAYTLADRAAAAGMTYVRAFILPLNSPATVRPYLKEGTSTGPRIAEFVDGTSNTWLLVEARDAVEWTRPVDLPFDGVLPLPPLGPPVGPFLVAFADGTVRSFRQDQLDEAARRKFIGINDGLR